MPICPHCGSYVSEGSPICSCGASFGRSSYEEEKDPEEEKIKEKAKEYVRKGYRLKRERRYEEALQMFEKSRELGSHSFSYYDEARLYNEMGEYKKALECLEYYKNTNNYGILQTIAWTLSRLGRYDEALELYFKAIGVIEKSSEFIQNYESPWGGIYHTKEELDRQAREKQKSKRRELSRVYASIGLTYAYQENFKVAIRYADEAIEYGGDVADNLNVKAIILEHMGNYEESLKYFDKAIEMENDRVFIENKARMIKKWCEELYDEGGDLEKAEKLILEAIDSLSSIRTVEKIDDYLILRDQIQGNVKFEEPVEIDDDLMDIGHENLFTITGTHFYGFSGFEKGMVLNLVREPDNEFDKDAIAVYYCGRKVGYVANSPRTVCGLTTSASNLNIGDTAYAEYVTNFKSVHYIARLR